MCVRARVSGESRADGVAGGWWLNKIIIITRRGFFFVVYIFAVGFLRLARH